MCVKYQAHVALLEELLTGPNDPVGGPVRGPVGSPARDRLRWMDSDSN